MTSDDGRHHPGLFRGYRITVIYIALAITAVLALLIWDRVAGPILSVCKAAAAPLTGS
jgi:nitrogen fixation/metabolism regulation signal transduction histidine kinase